MIFYDKRKLNNILIQEGLPEDQPVPETIENIQNDCKIQWGEPNSPYIVIYI